MVTADAGKGSATFAALREGFFMTGPKAGVDHIFALLRNLCKGKTERYPQRSVNKQALEDIAFFDCLSLAFWISLFGQNVRCVRALVPCESDMDSSATTDSDTCYNALSRMHGMQRTVSSKMLAVQACILLQRMLSTAKLACP